MTYQEDNLYLGKIVFDENKKRNHGFVWKNFIQFSDCFFFDFFAFLFAFQQFVFLKLVTNQLFGWKFCVVQQKTFYLVQDYEQVDLYRKIRVFISLVGPSETGKSQLRQN